ncbi:MAG: hypothetical protein EOR08_20345, partial [Mesorhizobium sp.]
KTVTHVSGSKCYPSINWTDGRDVGAHLATLADGEIICDSVFLPVTIRGEMPGRAMRGSANRQRLESVAGGF